MAELPPPPELLRALSRLVRGLSALFWGLPLALVVSVQTARTTVFDGFGILPPLLTQGLLLYGLQQMGGFQKQERVWRLALDRARLVGLVNFGLSPFLYWVRGAPGEAYFRFTIWVLAMSGLVFLVHLNQAMQRLAAMLPDETLRIETRLFTGMNLALLLLAFCSTALWVALRQFGWLPQLTVASLLLLERLGLITLLLLVLLPVALTMALLWRLKEIIIASVFAPHG